MIQATHIRRVRGTARLRHRGDAVELATDDSGILQFRAQDGQTKAVDDTHDFTIAGDLAFTGATTGVRGAASVTAADTASLTAAQSGLVVIATKGSATQVFTLPLAATAGLTYSFVCGHADGEIHLAVGTGDRIVGKTSGAEDGTGLITTVSSGLLKNTASSNVVGDFTTVVSDGSVSWYMTAVAGAWSAT